MKKKFDSVIIYSFHTEDNYYTAKSELLKKNLLDLNLDFQIDSFKIPPGLTWPDLCRKKIGMLYNFYIQNPGKKIFWIDVDCILTDFPDFVGNFSSDIIGFQRGFGSPLKIGYHNKARFWEPCLLGFNGTPGAKRFLEDAFIIEQNSPLKATDDYFFEESWRQNCSDLSYQVIPSKYKFTNIESKPYGAFFGFGASGNVAKFKGKVVQHVTSSVKPTVSGVVDNTLGKKQGVFFNKIKVGCYSILSRFLSKLNPIKISKKNKSSGTSSIAIKALPLKALRIKLLSAANAGDFSTINEFEYQAKNTKVGKTRLDLMAQSRSLLSYVTVENSNLEDFIPLCWWINPAPGNFGDWLSPYIITKITGRPVKYISPHNMTEAKYLSVGSIAKFANKKAVVLGSGYSSKLNEVNVEADYKFVRGPLSRQHILDAGGVCPEVYGDPAIILPHLYTPSIRQPKSGRLALVRHFTHANIPLALPDYVDELCILKSSPEEIEEFIATLHQYDGVISSAMHGFIVSQAYQIPCALVTFEGMEDAVHGDGMKYKDYFLGVGLNPVDPIVLSRNLTNVNLHSLLTREVISETIVSRVKNELENTFNCK